MAKITDEGPTHSAGEEPESLPVVKESGAVTIRVSVDTAELANALELAKALRDTLNQARAAQSDLRTTTAPGNPRPPLKGDKGSDVVSAPDHVYR